MVPLDISTLYFDPQPPSSKAKCTKKNCKNEDKNDNLRPWIKGWGMEEKCLNEDKQTCPFVKYRYQVFDPAGAFLNTVRYARC